jgi:ribonuclease G
MTTRTEGGTGDEILINVTPRETRVAVVENGVLQEILIERAGKRGLVGNIYQGASLPGIARHGGGFR